MWDITAEFHSEFVVQCCIWLLSLMDHAKEQEVRTYEQSKCSHAFSNLCWTNHNLHNNNNKNHTDTFTITDTPTNCYSTEVGNDRKTKHRTRSIFSIEEIMRTRIVVDKNKYCCYPKNILKIIFCNEKMKSDSRDANEWNSIEYRS